MNLRKLSKQSQKLRNIERQKSDMMSALAQKLATDVLIATTKAFGLKEGEVTHQEMNDFDTLINSVAHKLQKELFVKPTWPEKKEKKTQENEVKIAEVP